jgi:hypothetical protein
MPCSQCASFNEANLSAEVMLHFVERVKHPGLLAFPDVLVCLDCGFSRFNISGAELQLLMRGYSHGAATNEC